jgi:hypothetical protein
MTSPARHGQSRAASCTTSRIPRNKGIFSLYMIWQDEMAYRNYAGSPFVRAFNSILSQGMLTEPPVVETWRSLG